MYQDRVQAGRELADRLAGYALEEPILLAVPRGGVLVAGPVAEVLGLPIHILITRKIGHPQNEEVAIGAVMPDGSAVLDDFMIKHTEVNDQYIREIIQSETEEIKRRMLLYAGSSQPAEVGGKTAVIIDDGIATGYTIKAAIKWLKRLEPKQIVVAVPVAPPEVVGELKAMVNEVVCPLQPEPFWAVGQFYEHFPQNTDEEVIAILKKDITPVPL